MPYKKTLSVYGIECFFSISKKTAFVSFVANMSYIECTAVSHPACYPSHSCKFPTAFVISSVTILMATFPVVLRSTYSTPIGCKPGFLSRGNAVLGMYVSSEVLLF